MLLTEILDSLAGSELANLNSQIDEDEKKEDKKKGKKKID